MKTNVCHESFSSCSRNTYWREVIFRLRRVAPPLWLSGAAALGLLAQQPLTQGHAKSETSISCESLKGFELPRQFSALPTLGAYVKSAKLVQDSRGEYCKVMGGVRPVDPKAQEIRFEVNLPSKWNHKAVHFGGGAFDGWLGATNGLNRTTVSVASQPGPLARGFATFGGDSGHHKHYLIVPDVVNAVNASFAQNLEERRNFARDGLKKTHDAAMAIIERHYGTRPERMFFLGGSTGGREALFVVQRWPEDYDGVLAALRRMGPNRTGPAIHSRVASHV
ncbi:MAG: hypothetical protein NVS9B15_15000 [Acidobacteriaceae bacterium]